MPRAIDPSLPAGGIPLTHNPLNTIQYNVVPNPMDLAELLQMIIDGFADSVRDYIFPAIEQLTGIDLSVFLPLLDVLDLDFSTPAAFLTSLVAAIVALPAAIVQIITGMINQLTGPEGAEQLTELLGGLIAILVSLPAMLQQLLGGLIPWLDIEGSDFLNGALDGISLEPGAVLRMIREAIGAGLEDVPLLGEIIQPLTGLMGNVADLERRFQNLFDTFTLDGGELDLPSIDFDPLTVITRMIDDRIKPLEMLAELVDSVLPLGGRVIPDTQKPDWLQVVNDNIHNAFANLGNPLDSNTSPPNVLDAILGIFGTGRGAAVQSSSLAARVAALEAGGGGGGGGTGGAPAVVVIDFAGGAAALTSLGAWNVISTGGGGGNMALDGSGNLRWNESGAGTRAQVGRYNTPLTVDNGIVETILSSSTQAPGIFGGIAAYTYVNFRMNTTSTVYTRLLIGYNELRLQYVNGGVTNLTSNLANPHAGDTVRVTFGDAAGANPLHFTVSLNNGVVFNSTVSGPTYGASNLHIGVGMSTGTTGGLFPGQTNVAGLAVVTATEVL